MAVNLSFSLTGTKEAASLLRKIKGQARLIVQRELYMLGEEIMTESKSTYCPVDTGNLRASGYVAIGEKAGAVKLTSHSGNAFTQNASGPLVVTLGYGGPACKYAAPVHELNRNYNNGKQWKYLETPFKSMAPQLPERLKSALKNV